MVNKRLFVSALVLLLPVTSFGQGLTLPHQFVNGEPADAGEVNANFETLRSAISQANDGQKLGDCQWSILDVADFNSIHAGQWARLEGQSIVGSELHTTFGIDALPDAVSDGAFIRQVGGESAPLATFQDDATARPNSPFQTANDGIHSHDLWVSLSGGQNSNVAVYPGAGVAGETTGGDEYRGGGLIAPSSHSHSITGGGDAETRPKNIALNFYCLISY